MLRYLSAVLLLAGLHPDLHAQPMGPAPGNDRCANATTIVPGQVLGGQDNSGATKSMEFETPATLPITCVQSVENDLWYSFTTIPGAEYYEVVIAMQGCNTPAGLQALIIQSSDCNPARFHYKACANKINTDTIKLFLHCSDPNLRHLIWVDGYDGTICEFEISLSAKGPLSPADYRFLRYDYSMEAAHGDHLPDISIRFENNVAVLRWNAPTHDPVAVYLVEQIPHIDGMAEEDQYAQVVGIVDPNAMVGSGEAYYEFQDFISNYIDGKPLKYRIVQVLQEGQREVSETLTITPQLISTFYAAAPKPGPTAGTFIVHYLNHKKGQDLRLQVINDQGIVVKEHLLSNEPERDGDITLQMATFPPGNYTFIMSAGREKFKHAFHHHE